MDKYTRAFLIVGAAALAGKVLLEIIESEKREVEKDYSRFRTVVLPKATRQEDHEFNELVLGAAHEAVNMRLINYIIGGREAQIKFDEAFKREYPIFQEKIMSHLKPDEPTEPREVN